jgi:hypothetical protein
MFNGDFLRLVSINFTMPVPLITAGFHIHHLPMPVMLHFRRLNIHRHDHKIPPRVVN